MANSKQYRTQIRTVVAIRYTGDNVGEMRTIVAVAGWKWLDCGLGNPVWRDRAILFYGPGARLITVEVGSWLLDDGTVLTHGDFTERFEEVPDGQV